eukprot:scaffold6145_cov102-Isochrysis_galbana.AAC.7
MWRPLTAVAAAPQHRRAVQILRRLDQVSPPQPPALPTLESFPLPPSTPTRAQAVELASCPSCPVPRRPFPDCSRRFSAAQHPRPQPSSQPLVCHPFRVPARRPCPCLRQTWPRLPPPSRHVLDSVPRRRPAQPAAQTPRYSLPGF